MRTLLVVGLVVGCSSGASTPRPPVMQNTTSGTAAVPAASVISPDVIGVLRTDAVHSPITRYFTALFNGSVPACWTEQLGRITNAYQLHLPNDSSYFLYEGPLVQADVEACALDALKPLVPNLATRRDGDFLVFSISPVDEMYTAWRPGIVIAGSHEEVTAALKGGGPDGEATWKARLAKMPSVPYAAWRQDRVLSALFGVAPVSYVIALDRFESVPKLVFEGRIVAEYATEGDAAIAARRIKQGETHLPSRPPVEITEAFKRMKVTQDGTRVTIAFDRATYAGVETDEIMMLAAQLSAAVSTPPAKP